jgi:hypothetical protein
LFEFKSTRDRILRAGVLDSNLSLALEYYRRNFPVTRLLPSPPLEECAAPIFVVVCCENQFFHFSAGPKPKNAEKHEELDEKLEDHARKLEKLGGETQNPTLPTHQSVKKEVDETNSKKTHFEKKTMKKLVDSNQYQFKRNSNQFLVLPHRFCHIRHTHGLRNSRTNLRRKLTCNRRIVSQLVVS